MEHESEILRLFNLTTISDFLKGFVAHEGNRINGSLFATIDHNDKSFRAGILILILIATITYSRRKSNQLPLVNGGLQGLLASLYPISMKDVFETGFSKFPHSAFRAYVFPFGKVTVLSDKKLIDEMNHASPEHLSFDDVSRMLIQPDHTCFGQAPGQHPIVVINQNFNRRLAVILPDMIDDIKESTDEALGEMTEEWRRLTVHPFAEKVTSKAALRAVVGSPLCEDPKISELIYAFVTGATRSAFRINIFPRFLHSIVGPWFSSIDEQHKTLVKAIIPVVDERRQKWDTLGKNWLDKPDDYLMCLIESAPPGPNYESSYEGIAARLLQFAFASFHTSGNALSHLLFDLASAPSYADALREEISEVFNYEGLTTESMQKMRLTDGFMAESARLNPVGVSVARDCSIGLTSISRVARKSYTFSDDKTMVPKGAVVMASMNSIHRDEQVYPNPDTFDPYRYSSQRAQSSETAKNPHTSVTPNFMYFGHGKRPCPGRFFASMELKAILCHIIRNYDVKVVEGIARPPNDHMGIGVLPSKTAEILIRRRVI